MSTHWSKMGLEVFLLALFLDVILADSEGPANRTLSQGTLVSAEEREEYREHLWRIASASNWTTDEMSFVLYKRGTPGGAIYTMGTVPQLKQSTFDPSKKTVILCHGWRTLRGDPYITTLKDALVANEDVNVFMADWELGSFVPYETAIERGDEVGAAIARFIKMLERHTQTSRTRIHLIGVSLGGHVVAAAGKRLRNPKLGRISGLDVPDRQMPNDLNLTMDPTDAEFVDEIRTFLSHRRKGHANFVVNGGVRQPACRGYMAKIYEIIKSNFAGESEAGRKVIGCDHHMSLVYYTESITNRSCKFTAVACPSYKLFRRRRCRSTTDINYMGYHAVKPSGGQKMYYLSTASRSPYCLQ